MPASSNSVPKFALIFALTLLPGLLAAEDQNVTYGKQMLGQKQYDKAIQYFGVAIKADPKSAEAYKGAGYAYAYKGDKAHALQYLKYAAQLNPSDTALAAYVQQLGGGASSPAPASGGADQMIQYGNYYLQQKQYDNAIAWFNKATQADPGSAKAWKGLGYAYVYKGDKPNAITALEKAAALNPSDSQLSGYLASLRGSSPSADSAPTAKAGGAEVKEAGVNPWVMGSTVAVLGAVMLFLF